MRINVKLMGWMREYLGPGIEQFHERAFELADGATLGELSDTLGFRAETVFMAMQNGERVADDDLDQAVLADGDEVVFVPPIKGG